MKIVLINLVLLLCGILPSFSAEGGAVLLVDSSDNNGGFENEKMAPWKLVRSRDAQKSEAVVTVATDTNPAAEGKQFLTCRAVNKDETANSSGVMMVLKTPDISAGRLFRVTWKTRSRADGDMNVTSASVAFVNDEPGLKLLVSKRGAVAAGKWSEHVFEAAYQGESPLKEVRVSLTLGRSSHDKSVRDCEGYLDDVRVEQLLSPTEPRKATPSTPVAAAGGVTDMEPPIPVHFKTDRAGFVTLVLEDDKGVRVRNLVAATWFEAGEHTVFWDGLDEGRPIPVPGSPQAQTIQRTAVAPATYRVRGLLRDALKLTYEFTVYPNVGKPPWITDREQGSGGWLADHGVPTATAFIPAARAPGGIDQILITCPVAESSHALAWVDLAGNKISGRMRLGGRWTGASILARDLGKAPHPEIYLYTLQGWSSDQNPKQPEVRLMGLTKSGALSVGMIPHAPDEQEAKNVNATFSRATGLAVYNGLLVYSTIRPGMLHFYDTTMVSSSQRAKHLGSIPIDDPEAIAFEPSGRLLVVSGKRLLRYAVGSFPEPLSKPQVIVDAGLEEPRSLTVDEKGHIYIADWGESHQIKVFSADGHFASVIGKPGKPGTGPFDPQHMNFPYGMTVAADDTLWVAGYQWRTPKTVTVWKLDGKYVRSFYGPPDYGGGGFLDANNSKRFLYAPGAGGIEFQVDWTKGAAAPTSLYWLASETPYFTLTGSIKTGPMFPRKIGTHAFITNEFGGPVRGTRLLTIWKDCSPQAMKPMVFIGAAAGWPNLENLGVFSEFSEVQKDPKLWYKTLQSLLVCWTDDNRDGLVQKGEVKLRQLGQDQPFGRSPLTTALGTDYDVLITFDKGVAMLKPRRVDPDGLPTYDLADLQPVATGLTLPAGSGGAQTLETGDGSLVVTGGPMYGVRDGKVVWTYHSQWPGLHAGHAAPNAPEYPGQLLATTRLLGPLIKPQAGEGGELWAINSDKGLSYLLTADGLYVDSLFQPPATGRRWDVPEATRGMDVTGFNYSGETFWPSITQLQDGRIFMVVGKQHSSLVEVHGLDSIKRISGDSVAVTAEDLQKVEEYRSKISADERRDAGSSVARIVQITEPIKVDGKHNDWPALNWLPISKGIVMGRFSGKPSVWTAAALAVDNERLYVLVRTRQKALLANSGADLQTLFATGGSIDLQMASKGAEGKNPTEGDVRLLITQVGGKPMAGLWRAVVPGTKEPVHYESPVGTTNIDKVEDISSEIQMAVEKVTLTDAAAGEMRGGEFTQIEVAIPLKLLDWNPSAFPKIRGDIGVIVGKSGATDSRSYWHNKNAGIVNDIPSEARINPAGWGPWEVVESDEKPATE